MSLFFGFLSLVLGIGISLTVLNYGWVTLIVLPALALVFATVWNTNLGLASLIILIFIQLQRVVTEFHDLPGPGKPLVAFLLLVIVIRFLIFNERPVQWIKNSFILLIYFIFLVINVIAASQLSPALSELIDVAQNLVLASIVLYIVQDSKSLRNAIWAIIIAGAFMASISVLQRVTGNYSNNFWGFGGWEFSGYVGRPRMTGPYETPNPYAQVLVVIFILALDRLWHEAKLNHRMWAGFAAIVCVMALIFTDSRGGFANLVVTVLVFFIFNRPTIPSLFVTLLIGAIVFRYLPPNFSARILTLTELNPFQFNAEQIADESFRGRTSENLAAWRMFLDHPILGVGLNNYATYYQDYSRDIGLDNRREARDPASLYLQLLADQGLVGTVVFLAIIYTVFSGLARAFSGFKAIERMDEMYITAALFSALAGYMFMSLYRNNAYTNVFWVLIGICMSALQVLVNIVTGNPENDLEGRNFS